MKKTFFKSLASIAAVAFAVSCTAPAPVGRHCTWQAVAADAAAETMHVFQVRWQRV